MLRVPTSRKRKRPEEKLNLVPIMDSVFIFIFFLLMSASFLKIYEIGSPIPIISDKEEKKDDKEPLALSLTLDNNVIVLTKGVPQREIQRFKRLPDGTFDYEAIHSTLIEIKKKNVTEDQIIFEPVGDLTYEEIVNVMDAVRMLKKTDDSIMRPTKEGIDEPVKNLFDKIIFSNLMS